MLHQRSITKSISCRSFDTEGKWILVVSGDTVTKREIILGGRNTEYFEVIEGLRPGETVITSTYQNYTSLFNNSNQILIRDFPNDFTD